jgi:hypothetical protein
MSDDKGRRFIDEFLERNELLMRERFEEDRRRYERRKRHPWLAWFGASGLPSMVGGVLTIIAVGCWCSCPPPP